MIRPTINNIVNSDPFELLEWAKECFGYESNWYASGGLNK